MDELLLAWFQANGRDLPWRKTRDAYAILVSEVMLQQTQVERVVPRYLRWLERWPTADALAAAAVADVLREWQGLGYNRRALNLHRAAAAVSHHGWPEDLTQLPGVGSYTAAAIRNFAFGEDVLPVDTNVRRVQERTGHTFGARSAQALMDLGASVCLARVPRCGVCPLAERCPSRGRRYEPLRKQSPLEGSFRQRRANALRAILGGTDPEDDEAVAALARDGLVGASSSDASGGYCWMGHYAARVETQYDELVARLRAASRPERPAPPEFAEYLEKVRLHAYEVTDDDVQALKDAGFSEDQIFEHTVSTAVAAGLARIEAGLAAL